MLRRRVGAKSQGKRRFGRHRKIKKTAREIVRSFHKTGNVYIIMLAIATAAIIAGAYVAYRYLLNREDKPLLKSRG